MEPKHHILAIDDQMDNLFVLDKLLRNQYILHVATGGYQALDYLNGDGSADLILLDVMMPDLDGFEVCRQLKSSPRFCEIPVIFLTSLDSHADEERGLSLGAVDFIHKPFSSAVVLARVRNHLQLSMATRTLRAYSEDLERRVAERTREVIRQARELTRRDHQLIAAQDAMIAALCTLAEMRDYETGNHIHRTQTYVRVLAERLRDHPRFREELNDNSIRSLYISAPLHDIGKVAISDAILHKPGKLTPDEWKMMQCHVAYGYDAITRAIAQFGGEGLFLRYAREIVYSHHERWNGSGYPQGLAGDAIPISARLMAVVDVYDALISKRVYKPAFSHLQAIDMIAAERGKHFDPDIVDAMLAIADEFHAIAQQFRDDGEETDY
ncbi:MAG: response regulator [Candidatus Competibacteraceae bacterium]